MTVALECAACHAERNKCFASVTNSMGYAGVWKPPSAYDKTEIIIKIAREAMASGDPARGVPEGCVPMSRDVLDKIHRDILNLVKKANGTSLIAEIRVMAIALQQEVNKAEGRVSKRGEED